ncbi:exodeoxyribonuclease V subunit alpha [Glaciecola sp. 1036]|uniref:exodeoxyribonuclease V subunit alpha n=1 Tax=Alteromonadaceae TaxID=72275 RepID=UPI003CFFFA24
MNWRHLISRFHGVSQSDAVIVAKIIDYYPLPTSQSSKTEVIYSVLLKLHLHLQQGNTCLPLDGIAGQTLFSSQVQDSDLIETEDHTFAPGIQLPNVEQLQELLSLWLQTSAETPPYVLIKDTLCLRRYYQYEQEILARVQIMKKPMEVAISDQHKAQFDAIFANNNQQINWQAVAVANALTQQFMVLNGGPGTGKTYTVARLLAMYRCIHPKRSIQLAAPTGKAAQRLSESLSEAIEQLQEIPLITEQVSSIPVIATTVHKLLGARADKTSTRKNQNNLLRCDLLVVDEFSMVDSALFAKLLRACKPSTQLILVGDTAQLPSVEPGNLLADLTQNTNNDKSEAVAHFIQQLSGIEVPVGANNQSDHVVTLSQNHRSKNQINQLAQAVHTGDLSQMLSLLNAANILPNDITESAFLEHQQARLQPFIEEYSTKVKQASHPKTLFDALKAFRILSPIRKGPSGVEQLNQWISNKLQNIVGSTSNLGLFHGQAIMITENDPSTGLNNGDIGVIWSSSESGQLTAYIERDNGHPMQISIHRLPKYETAFALTIHKTQGSEFEQVLIILPYQITQGCNRELVYTGITRAQSHIEILAVEKVLRYSAAQTNRRDTVLQQLTRLEQNTS